MDGCLPNVYMPKVASLVKAVRIRKVISSSLPSETQVTLHIAVYKRNENDAFLT